MPIANYTCSNLSVSPPANLGYGVSFPFTDQNLFSGDFNNDGLTDIVGVGRVEVHNNNNGYDYPTYAYIYYASRSLTGEVQYTYGQNFVLPSVFDMSIIESSIKSMSVIDIDGDGLNELLIPYFMNPGYGNGSLFFYVIGQNFPAFNYYAVGLYGSGKPLFTTGDINNDGRSDVIYIEPVKNDEKYPARILHYNPDYIYGSTEMSHCLFDTSIETSLSLPSTPKQAYLTDMNGNGQQDLFVICSDHYVIYWNQGGILSVNTFSDTYRTTGTNLHDVRSLTAGDFNGDGLLDMLSNSINSSDWDFFLNNGDGTFSQITALNMTIISDQSTENDDNRVFVNVVDFDCDGKSDVIVTKGVYRWVSSFLQTWGTFDYVITKWLYSTGSTLVEKYSSTSNRSEDMTPSRYITGDFNGDGYTELVNFGYDCINSEHSNSDAEWHIYKNINLTAQTGKVTSIHGDYGKTTNMTYSTLADSVVYTRGNSEPYPAPRYTIPLNVVKTVTQDNGSAGNQTSSYSYTGLRAHLQGKGLLGYTSTQVINSTLGTTVRSEVTSWHNTYYVPTSTRTTTIVGAASSQTENTITLVGKGNKKYFAYPSQTVVTDMDGNIVTTSTECNAASGNVTMERTIYGSNTNMYIQTEYQNYTTNLTGRSNKPQRVVETRQLPYETPFVTITEYSYDTNGRIIQRNDNAQSSTLHLVTNYTYDLFGNLTSEVSIGSGITETPTYYTYDDTHRFPVRIYTNPSSTVHKYTYDIWGNILTEQDSINTSINNLITHTYDGWGNKISTQKPGSGTVTYTRGWGSSSGQRFWVQEQGTARPSVKTWYDNQGRVVRTESVGAQDLSIISNITYDSKGQRIGETEITGNLTLSHTYTYDARGRLIKEHHPGNSTITYTYSSNGRSRTVNDNGRQTTYIYDEMGNLKTVQSPLSSTLTHTYSSNGKIRQTISDGATWTISYDECGNRTSLVDPDAGATTYTYDAMGREIQRIDDRGVVFVTNYDYLGRVVSRSAGNETITYTYGTSGNGQMRLISESNGTWSKSYTYDTYGRITQETMSRSGNNNSTRSMSYHYNTNGLLTGVDYPYGRSISYTYDSYGNTTMLNFGNNLLTWTLTGNTGRTTTSSITAYSNNTTPYVRTTQLDTNGNLQSRVMTRGNSSVQNDSYAFSPQTGDLTSRTLTGHPTETFTYDNLDRLVSVSVPGQTMTELLYSSNGNIIGKPNMGMYSYNSNSRPHAVDYIDFLDPDYSDLDPYQYIEYNAWNKPAYIYYFEGNDSYEYEIEYGPDGQRVKSHLVKNNDAVYDKFYWGDYEEYYYYDDNKTVWSYWIESPDGLAGYFWNSSQEYYLAVHPYVAMTDHLGSLTGLYDYEGHKTLDISYDAWGMRTFAPGSMHVSRGYTGHEHLDELGLINMNGRMYDPRQGRFLSPDPYVQAPSNPQNYNRYSYCLNNPLKYTDPDGEFWHIIIGATVGGIINLASNWDSCDGFWECVAAFGVGAGSGALVAATGGASTGLAIGVVALGGAATSATNNIIAQTGKNFNGPIDWGQVGYYGIVGAVAGIASYSVSSWAVSNLSGPMINGLNIKSPVLVHGINGTIGGATGGAAGGFVGGYLMSGFDVGAGLETAVFCLKTSAVLGGSLGAARGYVYANQKNINPWTGKQNSSIQQLQINNQFSIDTPELIEALDLNETINRINDNKLLCFPHDGGVFRNDKQLLPTNSDAYYREYMYPTPGISGPGHQRVVTGAKGEIYYSPDHYKTFIRIK